MSNEPEDYQQNTQYGPRHAYWDTKTILTTAVLLILAFIAGYFEYSVYPSIMAGTGSPNGYGEKSITLKLSFLTYTYNAVRCYQNNSYCYTLYGVPSLDFFQIFVLAIVIFHFFHFYNYWTSGKQRPNP